MLSRALSLATVTLLIGLSAGSARAQNLEAGKSPSQIFASTCTACHKSPRGLLKSVPAGSLPGFLRQHYTTSSDMAGVLATYLMSNGANDPRYQAKDQPKGAKGREGRQEATQSPEQPSERPSRRQRQGAAPEGAKPEDGQTPQAAGEGKPSRHKHSRRGKPTEEPKSEEAPKGEMTGGADKPASQPDTAKVDAPKNEPKAEPKAEPKGSESAPVRSDPVPQVTRAPEPAAAPAPAAPPVSATAPAPPPPPPPPTAGSGPPEAPSSK